MSASSSHDRKTDRNGLYIIGGISVIAVLAILAAYGEFNHNSQTTVATPFAVVEGCTVYRFDGDNYLAMCGNDKAAITFDNGKRYVITESKP